MLRGVRGATTVENNTVSDVLNATKELLKEILDANSLNVNDIASIIFSATDDLNAEFPAKAARLMGLDQVPLLCSREIAVPKSLEKCIRVLMHINSNKQQKEIKHIYLKNAKDLRKE
ncbi:chorismate mutase [candidate division WOR-1 bacterium RIFOXYA2_FULL_36_21]|uniref:chorismate mutase n=1 Tax=candidate division WOR-1 bacterium RIFOXYB2_FULL_36_35 TaxID=1802578 RepID=A0A1F4S5V2_UNCSA|nr:MAG: chorismate mutase [candidate division WOR-1 bacterium RIFOXYA2_FULL_36_21]OGC15816.1 MAG: chorismate mutase [candidate division WOR-1 bacterium RIFOXYB2_FULL_36_35]OGC15922.1 MAG: chorismate mutase [candidate division WOR-1 bacterium RIFOXYA12_FULL_36_13]